MIEYLSIAGSLLAISGTVLSICGTLINNCLLDHHLAMRVWSLSNPLLVVWATGFLAGLWDGGLSVLALLIMYITFSLTNAYGLAKLQSRS